MDGIQEDLTLDGPPAFLANHHDTKGFDCGTPALNRWLASRARRNHRSGASRVCVVTAGQQVVGFYALSPGAVTRATTAGTLTGSLPDPVPVILLGQLAVDRGWQGQGLGRALLRDALARALLLHREGGGVAVLVHALDEDARRFYQQHGFRPLPGQELTLMLPMAAVIAAVMPVT